MSCLASRASVQDCLGGANSLDDAEDMAPVGASPAADLQRQLAHAALRNFYTPASSVPAKRWGARNRLAATIVVAAGSWIAVFSLGATLIR